MLKQRPTAYFSRTLNKQQAHFNIIWLLLVQLRHIFLKNDDSEFAGISYQELPANQCLANFTEYFAQKRSNPRRCKKNFCSENLIKREFYKYLKDALIFFAVAQLQKCAMYWERDKTSVLRNTAVLVLVWAHHSLVDWYDRQRVKLQDGWNRNCSKWSLLVCLLFPPQKQLKESR